MKRNNILLTCLGVFVCSLCAGALCAGGGAIYFSLSGNGKRFVYVGGRVYSSERAFGGKVSGRSACGGVPCGG